MNWNELISNKRLRVGRTRPEFDIRKDFESDFGRIIFSPALRRMHDKTQVFPLTTDDNIHTRLTHSNEVMSIGFTFGLKLCESEKIKSRLPDKDDIELYRIFPTLLKNICLIHDIGNAPFGHFAEKTFSNYFNILFKNNEYFKNAIQEGRLCSHKIKDFTNYDGNAQGLRVLTKLQILNDVYGLNLTLGTLSAYIKYPNYENEKQPNESLRIEDKKHGVFFSEKDYFQKIMRECGLVKVIDSKEVFFRNPICYLMEAADSIAYLCMDLEDGYNKGLVKLLEIQKVFSEKINSSSNLKDQLNEIIENNDTNKSKIVSIRILLIGYLVKLAFDNFENNLEAIENGIYNKELIEDNDCGVTKALKYLTTKYILKSREINYLESTGYSIITGILDFYVDFIFNKKDENFRKRAVALISNSIIECAIEENIKNICEGKLENNYSFEGQSTDDLRSVLNSYLNLHNTLGERELDRNEKECYLENRRKTFEYFSLNFNDLDDYYKLRVIVDFISGMTDKFALNHYNRISGKEIA